MILTQQQLDIVSEIPELEDFPLEKGLNLLDEYDCTKEDRDAILFSLYWLTFGQDSFQMASELWYSHPAFREVLKVGVILPKINRSVFNFEFDYGMFTGGGHFEIKKKLLDQIGLLGISDDLKNVLGKMVVLLKLKP